MIDYAQEFVDFLHSHNWYTHFIKAIEVSPHGCNDIEHYLSHGSPRLFVSGAFDWDDYPIIPWHTVDDLWVERLRELDG